MVIKASTGEQKWAIFPYDMKKDMKPFKFDELSEYARNYLLERANELHLEDVLGTEKDIVTKGLEDELDRKMLYKEVAKLVGRDKEIIEYRYGLNGKKELTQKEVASLMGISQSYISRIEKKVIKKLRTIIKT